MPRFNFVQKKDVEIDLISSDEQIQNSKSSSFVPESVNLS